MKSPSNLFLIAAFILLVLVAAGCVQNQSPTPGPSSGSTINITAAGRQYPAYLAIPSATGRFPAVVLVHSFNGMEQGYLNLSDRLASEGYVVLAPQWQTYGRNAGDQEVEDVLNGSVAYLSANPSVDSSRIGLTGFCAGGRYTMLFLSKTRAFRTGVAWYGFPYNRGYANDTTPSEHVPELTAPMLMIHGSRDVPSPIDDIYQYTTELDAAGKYFELKVYQGKGHGFMIVNGTLAADSVAEDAYREMSAFFNRTLK